MTEEQIISEEENNAPERNAERQAEERAEKCNLCSKELTPDEEISHDNRCQDCFEEWGNEWPDRV